MKSKQTRRNRQYGSCWGRWIAKADALEEREASLNSELEVDMVNITSDCKAANKELMELLKTVNSI